MGKAADGGHMKAGEGKLGQVPLFLRSAQRGREGLQNFTGSRLSSPT